MSIDVDSDRRLKVDLIRNQFKEMHDAHQRCFQALTDLYRWVDERVPRDAWTQAELDAWQSKWLGIAPLGKDLHERIMATRRSVLENQNT